MRTSPVHYIAPSAISIVPNCNGSANDVAVTISRGTKIKVYSPRANIEKTSNGEYQEWTLTGRNRRLADTTGNIPYTIYARLKKDDPSDGYIVFSAKFKPTGEGWVDSHPYVTQDGIYFPENVFGDDGGYWWIRLGDVLAAVNNQRTVTLDTGILGTQQFNDEWALRPDELPLRIELGCTIGDEDVGQTPYVYWGQELVLTAMLTEGWTGTDIQRFDRWEIIRNSGDAAADNTWNYQEVEGQDTLAPRQMPDGQITLQHIFGETDDFNGAVAVTFTILAVGHTDDTLQREILKTATINIMAETVATYELEQSAAAVTYNPLDNTYSPANVVSFRIRTKAQDGSVSFADDSHIAAAQLQLYALPEGDAAENRTRLTFTGGTATLPVTDFAGGKSINFWLENGAQVVLARTTVAYIRYGEKGDTPISIYRWYKVGLTPLKPTSTSSEEPAPAAGDATGAANVYPTDKWSKAMPDRPATGEWNLWQCNSIKHGSGAIDTWSTPVRISGDKGTAGEDGSDREYIYIRQETYPFSGKLPANISTGEISPQGIAAGSETDQTQDDWVPNGWSDTALPADNDNRYVYMAVREKPEGINQQWGPFGNPVLWSNWGVRGTDGDGVEHVFIRTQNNVAPVMDSIQTGYAADEFRPTITADSQTASLTEQAQTTDDPKGPNSTYPYEWVATRSKGAAASDGTRQWTKYTGKNNDYKMSLWSRWAEDGEPSVRYYIKTDVDSVTIPADSNQINIELNGEFHKVTGSTDEVHSCAFVLYARKADGQRNAIAHASSVGGYNVDVTVTPDIQAYEALMQEALANDPTVYLARKEIIVQKHGDKGDTPIGIYRWYKVGLTPLKPTSTSSEEPAPAAGDATGAANVYPTDKWSKAMPDRPATGEWNLWQCNSIKHGSGAIDTWSTPVRISGDKGTAGEDGSDREYIYIRQETYPFSGKLPANISTGEISPQGIAAGSETDQTQDDWVPNGWSDTALPADNDNRYVYMAVREKPAGEDQAWGPFGNPVLWSNWGVRGTDGDGVEHVFIRTQNNVAPIMDSVQTGYAADEFRPTITADSQTASLTEQTQTTDDPKGPNSTYPYEWVATRSKGAAESDGTRQWTKYTGKNNDYTMSLWSRWAEDGEPSVRYYIKTDVDSVTIPANSQQINIILKGEFHKVTGSTDEVHSCAFVLYARKADGQRNAIAHASSVEGYNVDVTVTPDIQAYEALMQETLVNDPTVYLSRKEIIVQKHGDNAQEINPNILLRTIFDRGIDFVLEAWTRTNELIAIDGATDTIVNGRKSLRMNASSQDLDFQQNVFGKVKPSTWYTLSFNYFATQSFHTFLWDASNTTSWIDLSEGYYIDGSATPTAVTRIDGFHEWEAEWSGNRHSITFKTASTFSTTTLYVLFRCLQGGQVAICMPKLEEGRVATAYMAHEDDLKGDNAPYNEHAYALSRSRTSHADSDLYQVNNVRWFPSAPDPMPTHPYVWERIMHYTSAGVNDQTSYICLTGDDGATGRMGYPAGEWEARDYSRTTTATPIVHLTDDNGSDLGYWYLTADAAAATDKPGDNSTKWAKASSFGMVITQMLFTMFANLGGWVVAGDFFLSQYGTLVSSTGAETVIDMTNAATLFPSSGSDRRTPYAWFDGSDPMATGARPASGQFKFRPMKVMNAVTGEEWMAQGKVHVNSNGDVTMENITVDNAVIRGSLMFHKVVIEGTYDWLAIANTLGNVHVSLKGDVFVVSRNYSVFNISFPPAYLFPGAQVRIVIDRSHAIEYQLFVTRLSGEQAEYKDNQDEVYNGFVNILSGNWGVSYLDFSSENGQTGKITANAIELVAIENPVHRGYYVWMLVDAR